MKTFLKYNGAYLIIYLIILVFLGKLLLTYDKVQLHLMINSFVGNPYIDSFFKYITHLGDGLFAIAIVLILLFINVRESLYILFSYLGAGIISAYLKHAAYEDVCRPSFVFQYFVRKDIIKVDGIDLAGFHSFPSGHALSAFALFFCLIFITKNQMLKILFFVLALLAAYSRTYLSQHWLIDIYVGSIIGTIFSIVFYFTFYKKSYWLVLNQPLYKIISKTNSRV